MPRARASTASHSAGREPGELGAEPGKLRGSDLFPPLPKSSDERCEAL